MPHTCLLVVSDDNDCLCIYIPPQAWVIIMAVAFLRTSWQPHFTFGTWLSILDKATRTVKKIACLLLCALHFAWKVIFYYRGKMLSLWKANLAFEIVPIVVYSIKGLCTIVSSLYEMVWTQATLLSLVPSSSVTAEPVIGFSRIWLHKRSKLKCNNISQPMSANRAPSEGKCSLRTYWWQRMWWWLGIGVVVVGCDGGWE